MMRRAIAAVGVVVSLAPAWGASFYTQKPDDSSLIVLNKETYPSLHGDGAGDDTAVLQQAINDASGKGNVLLVPTGRYRVSKTIGIPQSTRVLGFGTQRPVLVLGANTPGYATEAPKYMVWFTGGNWGRRRAQKPSGFSDAGAGTFYSGWSNIDFEIGDGNAAAVAIRGHFAQHGIVAHVDFHTGSGFAGMDEIGNEAEDLHFFGGEYGIVTSGTSPSWQYTLLDSSFEGQRVAAFKTHHTGLTLVRDRFSHLPTTVAIDENQMDQMWMKDCRLEDVSGPAVMIGEEGNVRTAVNLENVACENVPTVAMYRQSGKQVASGQGERYMIRQFSYGLQMADLGAAPVIAQTYAAETVERLPAPVQTDIAALPPMETWANLKTFGAAGDGHTDDLPAFKAAIDKAKVIFVPRGRYRVTNSIMLKPGTVLVGLNPITTQIGIEDGEPAFAGEGEYKGVVEASRGASTIICGIGLDSGANNPRATGLKWAGGTASMVNDVKFLGGHGTGRPDRRLSPVYNADHSGDGDPHRKWDSSGPGLWVTDGGGGTFANIWTASTFSNCGMLVENTHTPGHVYELSSEHHVQHEIQFHNVSNWDIAAQQTEEEWGESAKCLPVEITGCEHLTFANTILFRVFGMAAPFSDGVRITNSRDIQFRGMHAYGQSAFNFDDLIEDASLHAAVRSRALSVLNISGNVPAAADAPMSAVVAAGASLQKVGGDFFSADHAVSDVAGNAYFVDMHQNKVFAYSAETREASVLRDDVAEPFALAVDRSQSLMILSHKGKVFSLPLAEQHRTLTELSSVPAAVRPEMKAVLPADRWWDGGHFLETNARVEPLQFLSPDRSIFLPAPADYATGRQHNWTSQPIDLYRGYQLALAAAGSTFYVADENEHKTWAFTATEEGTLINPHLFAQHGEAGV